MVVQVRHVTCASVGVLYRILHLNLTCRAVDASIYHHLAQFSKHSGGVMLSGILTV